MKTRLLIIFAIGIIGFMGFAFADYDPNELQVQVILPPSKQMQPEMDDYISYNRICPENTDWPDAPNRCDRRENYTRTELKNLYDEYYQYKGAEWMEMKKAEMDSVIASGLGWGDSSQLWHWLGHAQQKIPFENINVYLYYSLNGQAPHVGWSWYAVDNEFEPVITLYYVSPGAIMIISLIIITGAITGVIFSFKEIGLHPKRKTLAVIGFALISVGITMYSISIFGIIQSQINQIGEELNLSNFSYHMLILFGIPIALVGIPVILHGLIQRFSIMIAVLMSLGMVFWWVLTIFWGMN